MKQNSKEELPSRITQHYKKTRKTRRRGGIWIYVQKGSKFNIRDDIGIFNELMETLLKGAVTDMRYFVRSKFSRSLVHKKNFTLV